jgi:hypothetical protein
VSGSINLYNSSNAATKNDVYLTSGRPVKLYDNITTSGSGYVMTVTPDSYSIGRTIVAERNAEYPIQLTDYTSSVKRIALVKSGIYSKVEISSPTNSGTKGVVGIDFDVVKASDFSGSTGWACVGGADDGAELPDGLSYYYLRYSTGKYALLKVNKTVQSTTNPSGSITAEAIVFVNASATTGTKKTFSDTPSTSFNTTTGYQASGSTLFGHLWIDCDVFDITAGAFEVYKHVRIHQPSGTYKICIAYFTIDNSPSGEGFTGIKVE